MSLPRVLEPEVMDTASEARDYDAMDHAAVNARFVEDLLGAGPDLGSTLDVGTGTALVAIELRRRAPEARVLAVDLAEEMLALGRRNVEIAGVGGIELQRADAKELPFATGAFRCVISNSLVHHLPDPAVGLEEMVRVLAPGGLLFVRDLFRPDDDAEVARLLALHAGRDTPSQRALFEASLRAALRVDEVRALAGALGVPASAVRATSDRHFTLSWRNER